MEKLERRIDFNPAFDKRNADPSKNYGIHGVEMRWYVIGEKGAVQFVVFTNWMLPHIEQEERTRSWPPSLTRPMPADVGFHSRVPMYEGQAAMEAGCSLLGGGPCYYDGSAMQAQNLFDKLLVEGGEAVWIELEARWRVQFEPEELEQLGTLGA
jgi:hypothetical protein